MPSADMECIQWLQPQNIDIEKWNSCVAQDSNATIYNRFEYINVLADNWIGLVIGDYETVMPCPYKLKLGLKLLYAPAFVQHISICGNHSKSTETDIYNALRKQFSVIDIAASHLFKQEWRGKKQRTNFYLDLSADYEDLESAYTKPCRRNLAKVSDGLHWQMADYGSEIINLYQTAYGHLAGYKATHFQRLLQLNQLLLAQGLAENYMVYNTEGEVVFGAIIWKDEKRLYYILGAPTALGRTYRATYWFIDELIHKYAATDLWLDFEGSDIKNVADFYKSFNPKVEHYYDLYFNTLPFPFNKILDKKLNK